MGNRVRHMAVLAILHVIILQSTAECEATGREQEPIEECHTDPETGEVQGIFCPEADPPER